MYILISCLHFTSSTVTFIYLRNGLANGNEAFIHCLNNLTWGFTHALKPGPIYAINVEVWYKYFSVSGIITHRKLCVHAGFKLRGGGGHQPFPGRKVPNPYLGHTSPLSSSPQNPFPLCCGCVCMCVLVKTLNCDIHIPVQFSEPHNMIPHEHHLTATAPPGIPWSKDPS